jgi:ferredoxin-NADP reductase
VTERVAPRRIPWRVGTLASRRRETPTAHTFVLDVPGWPGHRAGQHVDVRLTAEDGYRAERSYSIASPPESGDLELTVDRLEDGEVSPFLTEQLRAGDTVELRGPIGGHFVWSAAERRNPLLLLGGGSGVVPLMCILRHRKLTGSAVPTTLVYSSRTRADVIYHDELTALAHSDPRFTLLTTLTRDSAPGWSGRVGRIDLHVIRTLLEGVSGEADSFVSGPNGFVEAAAAFLVQAGQPPGAIRTERFGPA